MFCINQLYRKLLCLLILTGILSLPLLAQVRTGTPTARDTVLVQIGDSFITITDLRDRINSMPLMNRARFKSIDGQKQLLENMTTEVLFYKKAVQAGYLDNPRVDQAIDYNLRQPIIEAYFFELAEKEVRVSANEIRQYYDSNLHLYRVSPRTAIYHLQADPANVPTIISKLEDGENFEDLIALYSINEQTKRNNGLIQSIRSTGTIPGIGADADLDNAISTAEVDDSMVYGPFETSTGTHFFKKFAHTPESFRDFDEVKEGIEDILRQQKQNTFYTTLVNQLKTKYNVVFHRNLLDTYNLLQLSPQDANIVIIESSKADIRMTLAQANSIIKQASQERVDVTNKEIQARMLEGDIETRLLYAAAQDDKFLEKNKDNYQLNQIRLNTIINYFYQEQVVSQVTVTNEEVLEYYHQNEHRYTTPASRDIREFVAKDQKAAKKHQKSVQNFLKKNQEDKIIVLLRKESLNKDSDGLIVNVYKNNIIPDRGIDEVYNQKVWEVEMGQVSDFFTDKEGRIVFFYVVNETPAQVRPLSAVEQSLKSNIYRNKVNIALEQKKTEYAREFTVTNYFDRLVSFISPEELFAIAEEAQKRFAFAEALNTFEQIIKDFPNSEHAYRAMFMKAFVTGEELKETEKAISIYQEMIRLFPDGDLNESAEFMIESLQLGTSIEELLENE